MGQLYDRIGIGYDTTRRPHPVIAERLGHHLELKSPGRYLTWPVEPGAILRSWPRKREVGPASSFPPR